MANLLGRESKFRAGTLELIGVMVPSEISMAVQPMFDSDRFFQACVVPYRNSDLGVEFCLITSKKSGKWSLPKGTIRSEETVSDTIARQAYKEAGVRGELIEDPIGTYSYHKWETILEVVVLSMRVHECDEVWPDAEVRKRCWVDGDEAVKLLHKPDHQKLVYKAIDKIRD